MWQCDLFSEHVPIQSRCFHVDIPHDRHHIFIWIFIRQTWPWSTSFFYRGVKLNQFVPSESQMNWAVWWSAGFECQSHTTYMLLKRIGPINQWQICAQWASIVYWLTSISRPIQTIKMRCELFGVKGYRKIRGMPSCGKCILFSLW